MYLRSDIRIPRRIRPISKNSRSPRSSYLLNLVIRVGTLFFLKKKILLVPHTLNGAYRTRSANLTLWVQLYLQVRKYTLLLIFKYQVCPYTGTRVLDPVHTRLGPRWSYSCTCRYLLQQQVLWYYLKVLNLVVSECRCTSKYTKYFKVRVLNLNHTCG